MWIMQGSVYCGYQTVTMLAFLFNFLYTVQYSIHTDMLSVDMYINNEHT